MASLVAPALVVVALMMDIGGQRQQINTLTEEVRLIRMDQRERMTNGLSRSQHLDDIRRIEERLSRNEEYLFGFSDGGTADKRTK